MYNSKYVIERKKDGDGNLIVERCSLNAKLDLSDEVAKKDKEQVKTKLEYSRGSELSIYLGGKGFNHTDYSTIDVLSKYKKHDITLTIRPLKFGLDLMRVFLGFKKLGLDIKVTAIKERPEKKMFDLEALHNFILNGKTE